MEKVANNRTSHGGQGVTAWFDEFGNDVNHTP